MDSSPNVEHDSPTGSRAERERLKQKIKELETEISVKDEELNKLKKALERSQPKKS